jgi:hypothetical protein
MEENPMFVKVSKPFVFLLTVLVVVSLACISSTETPSPEPPAAATEPPQAPTQPPETEPPAPPQPSAQEYFTEDFDGDISNWSQTIALNASDGDTSQADIHVEDGYLVFDLGKWLIGYVFYDPFEYSDVRIDVNVENRGTNVNNVLLVCRVSDEGHYLVNIANSGLYAMYAFDGSKGSYGRIADGGSTKIRPGKEVNEYTLVCKEKTLTIYINGVETRKYTDNQFVFRKGLVGVGVASEDQLPVKLDFDWVKISQP